jgi:predicted dithiol-disulfide oxidoreductase (DUF899 family)
VTKKYVLDGPRGADTLEQLFDGRTQLVVYHATFDPKTVTARTPYTKDAPCSMCSFWMDNFERVVVHLAHRDVTLIAASRAPVEKLEAYRKRVGWTFKWVSVGDGDFNLDYGMTFTAEEIANGQGEYNYAGTAFRSPSCPASASSTRTPRQGTCVTRTQPKRAASTCSTWPIITSTSSRRGATKRTRAVATAWVRRRDEYADAKTTPCQ